MFKELTKEEIAFRLQKLRNKWEQLSFPTKDIFIFSRTLIYYFTGTWANGLLYLPLVGEPILFCRKGLGRAKKEAKISSVVSFRSYSQVEGILKDFGYKLKTPIGVEKRGLTWELAELWQNKLKNFEMINADYLLAKTRSVKTRYELELLREAGNRHWLGLREHLPLKIRPKMTEYEISVELWKVFFELEHAGLMRMQACGEEIFLGHIAAGDSGIYGSAFNGPLCLRGVHPLVPQMGSPNKVWEENEPLTIDVGFCYQGYHTDKTQVYFSKNYKPAREVLDAQKCCEEIQEQAREMLKPGVLPEEIYVKAVEFAKKKGFEQGFMGLKEDKVNFLGHGIGLFIDEYPPLAKKIKDPLEENMVIALEPKIGLPSIGMVGVENTFLVTSNGGECITGKEFSPIWI
ncbi:Xaa-Pro aminopeptidase [Desulfonauticus submarinus]|uniref:Xaa-Pro aminopeptidase n=1 Tax=Desulfonauticus submarinus TaxID=206665 RepID=A0A1H0DIS5_9BACT|nr:Xaa-Pro peptidase family protein [Desulfonauticus submarinus]SDN69911.1 Xaa-Pro aminopeptidase [Desulfonauticus submarinus]